MKHNVITNVNLVENPSLHQDLWKCTSKHSMKDKGIPNVIIVENSSLMMEIWIFTSRHNMKVKGITNLTVRFSKFFFWRNHCGGAVVSAAESQAQQRPKLAIDGEIVFLVRFWWNLETICIVKLWKTLLFWLRPYLLEFYF